MKRNTQSKRNNKIRQALKTHRGQKKGQCGAAFRMFGALQEAFNLHKNKHVKKNGLQHQERLFAEAFFSQHHFQFSCKAHK